MNILMLRGQIPQDRNPQEIVFDRIEDCDDMWTQLVWAMTHDEDKLELWYWGGTREHQFAKNFTERWLPNFHVYDPNIRGAVAKTPKFEPDIIFCRGGFLEYHHILKRFPKAFKIYYGAGRRFLPQPSFIDYDLVLQDSYQQVKECKRVYPHLRAELFIKPAADNIFYPHNVEKEYDVCFPANWAQAFKGHKFVYSTAPKDLKILNLGNNPRNKPVPNNVTSYRVVRPEMAKNISKCKVGIVAVDSDIDSCPRVIPELLACGLPIVVLEGARFWVNKYINSRFSSSSPLATGEVASKDSFWEEVRALLASDIYRPREYYLNHLSLKKSAEYIRNLIERN